MKNLLIAFLYLAVTVTSAMAQEREEPKASSQSAPFSGQPSSEALVKALLAADAVQGKQASFSVEGLKKLVEREIAKSAALPLLVSTQTPVTQNLKGMETDSFTVKNGLTVIDGAVYLQFGGTIYPMNGGGASGCFDPDASARLQQARMKFAEQSRKN